jgi:urease subunit beta
VKELNRLIPGEYRVIEDKIELHKGRDVVAVMVANCGDRPIQVGSHYHFFEVNKALRFDRLTAYGRRLDIPAGTAVRFEPGEEKPVNLIELGGLREVYGLNNLTNGKAISNLDPEDSADFLRQLKLWEEGSNL